MSMDDRTKAIQAAQMFRIGAITVGEHGKPQKHESIGKAKEFVRMAKVRCVAQQKGEHLLEVMEKRRKDKAAAERKEMERRAAEEEAEVKKAVAMAEAAKEAEAPTA